jgi:hypothetical protein
MLTGPDMGVIKLIRKNEKNLTEDLLKYVSETSAIFVSSGKTLG